VITNTTLQPRIIETAARLSNIPMEKVIVNIEKYGNTSAATVPMAFHEAVQDGRIKRGDSSRRFWQARDKEQQKTFSC